MAAEAVTLWLNSFMVILVNPTIILMLDPLSAVEDFEIVYSSTHLVTMIDSRGNPEW